jgi:cytidylate kinase
VTPVVAIDGPAGSGKSTTARGVSQRLGLPVLDTGAMYRAATLRVLAAGVDPADTARVVAEARAAHIEIDTAGVVLDGRDVTDEIRGPAVTNAVSAVAANPGVREILVDRQRAWVRDHGGGVVEGRDIGTVVFPDAAVKVYLVASDAERARRRHRDEQSADRDVAVERVREQLERRDRFDSSRPISPLRPAPDAVVIDTSARSVDDVVEEIVARYRRVLGEVR